jgi:hypothetical protein
MSKLRLWMLFLVCAFLGVSSVSAQPPDAVQRALDDLNNKTGQNYVLGASVGYRFVEQLFQSDNLGCSNIASGVAGSYRAYVIEFDTNFDGVYEWDYRVSVDGAIFLLCSRPAEAVPTTDPATIPTVVGPTPSSCSSLLPRLAIGVEGRVLPTDPNIIRAQPGTSAAYVSEIPVGGTFTVLDGPRCTAAFTWWQVNYNGVTGWTVESDGTEYWLEPFTGEETPVATPTAEAAPIICDPALPPRLQRFETARVTPGDPNNVRREPGRSNERVGELPGGSEFRVLDGPRCADGLTWWNVQSAANSTLTGWTVEGASGEYFLEPPLTSIVIDSETVLSLAPLKSWDAVGRLTQVKPVSRTLLHVLTERGYSQLDMLNPFDASTAVEFEEGLTLETEETLFGLVARENFAPPMMASVGEQGITVFVPFTEAGHLIEGAEGRILRFDDAGNLLLTVSSENEVSVYDVSELLSSTLLGTISFSEGEVGDAIFSADGSQLLLARDNLIDVYTIDLAAEAPITLAFTLENDVYNQRLSISPDGQSLVAVGNRQTEGEGFAFRLFNLETQTLDWGLLGEGSEYFSRPVFTSDSETFLMTDSMGEFHMMRVFDVQSGSIIGGYQLSNAGELSFDPSNTVLILMDREGTGLELWGVSEG